MSSTTVGAAASPPAEGLGQPKLLRRAWPVLPLAITGWFVGLLPWFLARQRVGTFGTPWNPRNDMREALLPFHHEQLVVLLSVTLVAGALSGLASRWCAPRRGKRLMLTALAVTGAAASTAWSIAQTLSLHPDLGGAGETERRLQLGLVALTVAGSALGLLLGLAASLATATGRTLSCAPLAVLTVNWVGLLVTSARPAQPLPAWWPTAMPLLAGLLVGLCLATARVAAWGRPFLWAAAVALLVATQSAITATRYVLESLRGSGSGPDRTQLAELGVDAVTQVFLRSLSPDMVLWMPVLLALLVGALGLLLPNRPSRSTAPASPDPARQPCPPPRGTAT